MKNKLIALLLTTLLTTALNLTAFAQDTTTLPVVKSCGTPNRGVPNQERFQNLDAVGLLVSDTGDAMQAKPLQYDNVAEVFRKRIKEQIFPFLNADANCQIPDLSVFKIDSGAGTYLKDFMSAPRRLLIVVQIRIERLNIPNIKLGPWIGVLTLQYIRSDSQVLNYEDGIRDSRQLVIPLQDSDDEITKRLGWFASNIIVITNKQMPVERILLTEKQHEEIIKNKPPVVMIPIPDTTPEMK